MAEKNENEIKEQLIVKTYKKNNYNKEKCSCVILSFLTCLFLCFFLIPRKPNVILKNINVNNRTNYSIDGTFIFKNYNYYNVYWKKLEISLYWIPYEGQNVGNICYDNGNVCEYDFNIQYICPIKIGIFEEQNQFETKKKSQIEKRIILKSSNEQQIACSLWMFLNPYENKPQQLITKGHVHYNDIYIKNNKINIQTNYYYLIL